MGLASCEHTDGRVHFTGYIETVSDVPGHVWSPLARISDLRSHRETAKPMVRQPKLCEDLCWGTLTRIFLSCRLLFRSSHTTRETQLRPRIYYNHSDIPTTVWVWGFPYSQSLDTGYLVFLKTQFRSSLNPVHHAVKTSSLQTVSARGDHSALCRFEIARMLGLLFDRIVNSLTLIN